MPPKSPKASNGTRTCLDGAAHAAAQAFADIVSPADLAVVIVGDWNAAGADVAALGVADVTFLDETGQPAEAPAPPAEEPTE